jgi:hypothetical protein
MGVSDGDLIYSDSDDEVWLRSDPKPPSPSMHVPLSAARREANAREGTA